MALLTPTGIIPVYEGLERLERGLNLIGYIPIAGTISGGYGRGTLATAQMVSGLAIGIFYLFFAVNAPLAPFYATVAVGMIKHGVLNGIRSRIEAVPFLPLWIALPIDILFGRVFPYPG